MMFTPDLPIVVKVGSAEAGYGKIKITEPGQLADFRSCLALHSDYATAERFIDNRAYDLRIQKIGEHFRCYKRVSANWKGNVGNSILEEIPISDAHKIWAIECGKEFGMDILTVDAIHTTDDKEYILEINDSASGLAPNNAQEDMGYIR
jgi:glutathione synthase/RimK-type ligase-like ATP-grasp enzyme